MCCLRLRLCEDQLVARRHDTLFCAGIKRQLLLRAQFTEHAYAVVLHRQPT